MPSKNGPTQPQPDESPEAKLERLQRENRDLKAKLKGEQLLGDEIEKLKKRIQILEKEIKDLKSQLKSLKEKEGGPEDLRRTDAFLQLGEMCHQLQNMMYKEVHPKNYKRTSTFTVKDIESHIKDGRMYRRRRERDAAEQRWKMVKDRIGWDEKYLRTIKKLLQKRRPRAHPPQPKEEKDLKQSMKIINDELTQYGDFTAERLRHVIRMYGKARRELERQHNGRRRSARRRHVN